jgi:hypothetical protein
MYGKGMEGINVARFITLITLVIFAAGFTVWVAYKAAGAGQLNGTLILTLTPLLLLGSIALRGLFQDRNK